MRAIALVLVLAAPGPGQDPPAVLKTFRDEFVAIRAGKLRDADVLAFRMAKYEVPQNLWEAVTGSNPSRWKGRRNSAEMLSYDDATEFCRKVTALLRGAALIDADQEIRLPTEREWEYATRAGTATRYSFGDDEKDLGDYAWFHGNAAGNDPPVGAKKPNPWGLYDVHGYLWEWCEGHVIRGGSWKDEATDLTSSSRKEVPAETKDDAIGLRCVLAMVKK